MLCPGKGSEAVPKTSVIVPVYNVREYLSGCVDSVLHQTDGDLELLLVDDGSTDGSGVLCDELADTDVRIKVIHQENAGLGGARNTGLEAASGDWLLFVDSDDTIEPFTLERLLPAAEQAGAALVVFGFRSVNEQGMALQSFRESLPKEREFSLAECRELLLAAPSACNKLYRRELFLKTGVRFPAKVWYEDIRTVLKLYPAAEKMLYVDDICYNYLMRAGSITKNADVGRNRQILEAFDDLLGFYERAGFLETYRDELCYLTLFHAYLTASVRVLRTDRKHPLLKELADYLQVRFPGYRENPYLSRLDRNKRLVYRLLEQKCYGLIALLFRLKG